MNAPTNPNLMNVAQQHSRGTLQQTTCPYCGVGCGVDIKFSDGLQDQTPIALTGAPSHPANFGRLCVKGSHLLDTLSPSNRLLFPEVNGQRVTWSQGIKDVADRITDVIAQHGPEAVAFYVSGQLLTEDYYVANKLMKGFIGSANIDTNSRLCMSSAVAAYKRAFGADAVPCNYEDLESADVIVMIGSNAAWAHPVLFQRMERAKQINPNAKLVLIDPRATASASLADLHLAIKPGTDAILFNGLLHYLAQHQHCDQSYIAAHTEGYEAAMSACQNWTLDAVAQECDVDPVNLLCFYQWFADHERVVSFFSMGINQSTSGVDKGNSIINCHLATGKIGKEGCGPFSITGQPNAMGGREVGGLANLLAAHMDYGNSTHVERVARFWQAPNMAPKPGLKAVDMFEKMRAGEIKFVWIMATNPVVSMPNRAVVEAALTACEHVVVSDVVTNTDTIAFADVVLPAQGWSEKNGTVTNSERRISRQRGILPPQGEARPDWQIMCDVAKAMGFNSGFNFNNAREVFCEHAQLSGFENNDERAFDISALAQISERDYDQLKPIQWPVNQSHPAGKARLFEDGQFYTPSRKAQFIAITPRLPQQQTSSDFPYILNTGRMRDQWHTMTRTGSAARLLKHTGTARLHIHPADAGLVGVREQDLVALEAKGSAHPVILPVTLDAGLRKGELFAPIHWSRQWSSHVGIGQLFDSAHDPISGQPELKHAAVKIQKVHYAYFGHLAVKQELAASELDAHLDYWVKLGCESHTSYLVASNDSIDDVVASITALLGKERLVDSCKITFGGGDSYNSMWKSDEGLIAASFVSNQSVEVNTEWLDSVFGEQGVSAQCESNLLRRQVDEAFLQGPVICSCFNVRHQPIAEAIQQGANTTDSLGDKLKCGTNCGSCRSELSKLIAQHSVIETKTVL